MLEIMPAYSAGLQLANESELWWNFNMDIAAQYIANTSAIDNAYSTMHTVQAFAWSLYTCRHTGDNGCSQIVCKMVNVH